MQRITPEDWRLLFDLLDVALELPTQQLSSWLSALEPSQAYLRPTLEELLVKRAAAVASDRRRIAQQFMAVGRQEHGADGGASGDIVGPYRLLREIGRGGMSCVWLAERADGLLRRHVALKLPYLCWATPLFAARMARERDILTALEHPNIVRLYDAGITTEGRPYLVLQYIDGKPLDTYCRDHIDSLNARLSIVLQVARAVAYAHSRRIVHHDLKPANVLIDVRGEPRLLDFGVGRLLEAGPLDANSPTELELRAVTPHSASPEQISGEATSVSADVYSLGIILYELLSGQRPRAIGADGAAYAQATTHCDPRPPSIVTEDRALARSLEGDLDTIALKALKKVPADRYATMAAFADDIERYLSMNACSHAVIPRRTDSASLPGALVS
jgi:serine/threonine-protein kinase